jgi:hypothetical protein
MNERNYEVNEREKKLAQLSRDRNSVICENPSSSLSASSSSYDAPNHPGMEDESDIDSDIDVERIDDDPLAEIDNACDDMEIDQAHSPKVKFEIRKIAKLSFFSNTSAVAEAPL